MKRQTESLYVFPIIQHKKINALSESDYTTTTQQLFII